MRLSTLIAKLETVTVNAATRTAAATRQVAIELQRERDAKAIARATELLGSGVADTANTDVLLRANEIVEANAAKARAEAEAKAAKLKAQIDKLNAEIAKLGG